MTEQSFLNKLAELRARHCDEMSTPELAVLTRATARLRRSGLLHKCLQPGETAPDFTFIDNDNNHMSLYELLAQGPVIINFFRGFWCMYCKTELEAFASIKKELDQLGCHYLAVSPQKISPESGDGEPYQMIFDKNNQIARKFNIVYSMGKDEIELFESWNLNFAQVNESTEWTLPIPATYIIAQDRTVVYQFADVDVRTRCCPDDLIEELRQLKL